VSVDKECGRYNNIDDNIWGMMQRGVNNSVDPIILHIANDNIVQHVVRAVVTTYACIKINIQVVANDLRNSRSYREIPNTVKEGVLSSLCR
jgi:hypothetical protein